MNQSTQHSFKTVFILLLIFSLCSFLLAIASGSYALSASELLHGLLDDGNSTAHALLWQLRIPRAYTAFITGGLLALAGVLMQVLLRNPLADPYILGVSGGASVAALLSLLAGLSPQLLSGSAFTGALVSILLVFTLSRGNGNWNANRLLLTGVVLAAGWGACINFILSLSPDKPLRSMLFWLMGDLSAATAGWGSFVVLLLASLACLFLARALNILAQGDLRAQTLGIEVRPLRMGIFVLASILTAFAVVNAGSIGFVGLIVPHMMRLVCGSDHRKLIPASILMGGILLLVSDTLARTLIAPQQLPVGVITAFIGVPFFLFLLQRFYARQSVS